MSKLTELAERLHAAKKPEVLKFSACTVTTRSGYSWGAVTSSDEETIRLLCDVWNNRTEIVSAIRNWEHLKA